jgi:hypothetical protein
MVGMRPPNSSSERTFLGSLYKLDRSPVDDRGHQMGILVSIFDHTADASWKSIQGGVADLGNMPCLVAILSENSLRFFPKSS